VSGDPFLLLADRHDRLHRAAGRTLAEHTGGILLTVCLVLTAALPLVILELVNPFSEEFLLRTAYTLLTSTLCYLLFLPEGRRAGELRDPAFSAVKERLAALSTLVRGGHLADFCGFCKRVAEREHTERREALLTAAEADPKRARRLRRRAARLRPLPISPTLVLCGEGRGEMSDVGRSHTARGLRGALLRPVTVLASSILFSSVSVLPGSALDTATAVRILAGLFGVVMAAFAGYSAGLAAARAELALTERRILFLTSFCEEAGLR
jgi:hypothetical protein